MSQKFHVKGFRQVKDFDEGFTKNYKKSDEVYFFEVDIQDPEELHELHYDLPFLLVRMKI